MNNHIKDRLDALIKYDRDTIQHYYETLIKNVKVTMVNEETIKLLEKSHKLTMIQQNEIVQELNELLEVKTVQIQTTQYLH